MKFTHMFCALFCCLFTFASMTNVFANDRLVEQVIEEINSIGEVTLDDEELINELQEIYNHMTDTQKEGVENYVDLINAERTLKKLMEEESEINASREKSVQVEKEVEAKKLIGSTPYGEAILSVKRLKEALVSPNSLSINSIRCTGSRDFLVIQIDFSADNSLGGTGREIYYYQFSDGDYEMYCSKNYDPIDFYNVLDGLFIQPDSQIYSLDVGFIVDVSDNTISQDTLNHLPNSIDAYETNGTEEENKILEYDERYSDLAYPEVFGEDFKKYIPYLAGSLTDLDNAGFNAISTSGLAVDYGLGEATFLGERCDLVMNACFDPEFIGGMSVTGPIFEEYTYEELRQKLTDIFGADAISSDYPGSEDGAVKAYVIFRIPDTKLTLQLKSDKVYLQLLSD